MAPAAQALFDFTNRGGWLWLTHGEYPWLTQGPAPWSSIGTFALQTVTGSPATLLVDTITPQGQALADWLSFVGASAMAATLPVVLLHQSCQSADATMTRRLLYTDPASGINDVEMFTWDAAMGGRLVFSDVHLTGAAQLGGKPYPMECSASPPVQEKAIMFELFDTPTCLP